MTSITASAFHLGGRTIMRGVVSFTVTDQFNVPLPFRLGTESYGPDPFVGHIEAGVLAAFSVPDLAAVVPMRPYAVPVYGIIVTDADTRTTWQVKNVSGVTGATWALDQYTPPSSTPVRPAAFYSGSGAPAARGSVDPAIYCRLDTQQVYVWVGNAWVLLPASGAANNASSDTTGTFAENVSELMAVCALTAGLGVARSTDVTRPAVGIAAAGALAGATGPIRSSGTISNPAWSLTVGLPVMVGPTGTLTQTPPVYGYVQIVGTALTSTSILIRIDQPIKLG